MFKIRRNKSAYDNLKRRLRIFSLKVRRIRFWITLKGFLIISGICIVATIAYALWAQSHFTKPEDAGTFGDSFGALTSLFTSLAFAGLIFTLFVQKRELQFQREELKRLVDEQRGSKKQLENQFKQMSKDNFERTFFNILKNFNQFKSNFEVHTGPRQAGFTYRGLEAIAIRTRDVLPQTRIETGNNPWEFTSTERTDFSNLKNEMEKKFKNHTDFKQYFLQLSVILKFIDKYTYSDADLYIDILSSSLAHEELLIISLAIPLDRFQELEYFTRKYDLLRNFSQWQTFKKVDLKCSYFDNIRDTEFFSKLANSIQQEGSQAE